MFYSGLTEFDSHLGAKIALAESIETKDATVWVVKLPQGRRVPRRQGARARRRRLLDHAPQEPGDRIEGEVAGRQFTDVKATGPNEVTITLAAANADLPVILATPQFVIVKDGTTDFNAGIGTGPYKVKEFKPGVSTVGVRNENYWKPGMPLSRRDRTDRHQRQRRARERAAVGRRATDQRCRPTSATQRVASTPGYAVTGNQVGSILGPHHAR